MSCDNINPLFGVRGHVTLWRIDDKTGLKTTILSQPNQIQYSWGYIAAKQLGYRRQADRPDYHISAMYIEYENQGSASAAISVSNPRTTDISYYDDLSSSTNRNFLRVPLSLEPALSVSAGYEANLPVNQSGNQLTFFAQTADARVVYAGANKAFSAENGSKIYAACLVAAPTFGDRTKDVIFARTIFSEANQITKEPSSQVGITWDIAFL